MAIYEFRLPDVGEGTTEAEIATWHVAVCQSVTDDSPLVDMETDKAVVDITSPVSGIVRAINGDVGDRVPVGAVLVEIELQGNGTVTTGNSARPSATEKSISLLAPTTAARRPGTEEPPPVAPVRPATDLPIRVESPRASPSTRRKAQERGIALGAVTGTGPGGRITERDLDAYTAAGTAASTFSDASASAGGVQEIQIIGIRRRIAEKMAESTRRIPHFTYVEECDLTDLEALRATLNASRTPDQPKLTLLPFLIRAVVRLVPEFPNVNARYDEEAGVLHTYRAVHMGVATQTGKGLMVPVIRNPEPFSLWTCARELLRVTTAARDGHATREELSGSTITLTSLGALGGVAATPIINHPEVAIIGPNKLIDRPVVREGAIVVRTMMNLSSSFDHRIVDGHEAARFVQQFKRLVESPALLFLGEPLR